MTETSDDAPSPTLSPHKSASMIEESVGTDQTPEGEEAEAAPAHLDQLKRFEQQMTLLFRKGDIEIKKENQTINSSLRASGSGSLHTRVNGKLTGHIAKSFKEHRIRSRLKNSLTKDHVAGNIQSTRRARSFRD